MDFNKIETFCSLKDTLKKTKKSKMLIRRNNCETYLTKYLYTEQIKNSFN